MHIIVTSDGIPVEFTFTTGRTHDIDGIKQLPVNLPEGSELQADSAYTDYLLEEMLADNDIRLLAARKKTLINIISLIMNILYTFTENALKQLSVILPNICPRKFMR